MLIQILFVVLFALNMLSIWSTFYLKKCEWYRLAGMAVFALLPLITVILEQPRFELDFFWFRVAGGVAIALGIGIMAWSKFGPGLQEEMVTSGPYQYVRHPRYLGLIFVFVGWWWFWAAVYSFYFGMFVLALIWGHAYLEEKLILEKKFGDKYRAYRSATGMFWIK